MFVVPVACPVTVKVAVVLPAAMVKVDGTFTILVLLTVMEPVRFVGAGELSVTVAVTDFEIPTVVALRERVRDDAPTLM